MNKNIDIDDVSWEKDETPKDDAEILKLKVGEWVQGVLVDKLQSSKYDTQVYKIKCKDDEIIKIVLGTTLLDRAMKDKVVGELVKIERLADSPSKQGKPLQNWKTYHAKQG